MVSCKNSIGAECRKGDRYKIILVALIPELSSSKLRYKISPETRWSALLTSPSLLLQKTQAGFQKSQMTRGTGSLLHFQRIPSFHTSVRALRPRAHQGTGPRWPCPCPPPAGPCQMTDALPQRPPAQRRTLFYHPFLPHSPPIRGLPFHLHPGTDSRGNEKITWREQMNLVNAWSVIKSQ